MRGDVSSQFLSALLLALPLLRTPADLRVWWAATDAPEEYADALFDAFAERHSDPDALPFAVLERPGGRRRADAAATDHVHAFDHLKLQLRSGYRARKAYPPRCETPQGGSGHPPM